MSKKVTVEILKTVAGIGKQGDIKEVSIAQARNQLIPSGIAREVSGAKLDNHTSVQAHAQKLIDDRHTIVEKLRGEVLEAKVVGHGSRINHHFGAGEVVDIIKQKYQTKLSPEMISFEGVKHPKKMGEYDVRIDIAQDACVRVKLVISLAS